MVCLWRSLNMYYFFVTNDDVMPITWLFYNISSYFLLRQPATATFLSLSLSVIFLVRAVPFLRSLIAFVFAIVSDRCLQWIFNDARSTPLQSQRHHHTACISISTISLCVIRQLSLFFTHPSWQSFHLHLICGLRRCFCLPWHSHTRWTQFLFPDFTHNSFIFFLFFCKLPISVANNNSFSFTASRRLFVWVCVR